MLSDNSTEKRAFHYFSTAFLINFVFGIVSIIVSTSTFEIAIFSEIDPQTHPVFPFYTVLPSFIIGGIGTLIYVYYLWHGFELMSKVLDNVSMGKLGSILLLFSIFVYPVLTPLLGFLYNPPASMSYVLSILWIMIALSVAGVIGLILVVIALFRVGEHYDSSTIKIGAILLIFLGFIGAIILYVGFKDLENKPMNRVETLPPPPSSW